MIDKLKINLCISDSIKVVNKAKSVIEIENTCYNGLIPKEIKIADEKQLKTEE